MPASDPSLDQRRQPPPGPSSRSSSVSAPGRRVPEQLYDLPPLPSAPAASRGSIESIDLLAAEFDDEDGCYARVHIERERRLATTPLLPPLMTDRLPPPSQHQSAYQSPLQSPTIAPHPGPGNADLSSAQFYPSPPLSTKPSISSFRPSQSVPSASAPTTTCTSEVSSPTHLPNPHFLLLDLDLHDSWSDRLGHANFTVLPKPYNPDKADVDALKALGQAWDRARVNYTKHLARTGEHYGSTSKTYSLTEAKWAETEGEWKAVYDSLVERIAATGSGDVSFAIANWRRPQDDAPAAIPRMLDAEGKFPDLGDEDIVGPMTRETAMMCEGGDERYRSRFWKSFAERVGLRK